MITEVVTGKAVEKCGLCGELAPRGLMWFGLFGAASHWLCADYGACCRRFLARRARR